ncbi:hypothetical protein CTheo_9061 [Ceratobasidium theobromae]|uniref:Uncharacterized protein n=1 Tax=Ceratobasidium theobromae TaxID=1582974 RepID=A0A5N5Q704_9AGAM|nr:hypothetical protein CTheo_9061 [Ceratobasidium theobromae]
MPPPCGDATRQGAMMAAQQRCDDATQRVVQWRGNTTRQRDHMTDTAAMRHTDALPTRRPNMTPRGTNTTPQCNDATHRRNETTT